MLYLCTCGTIGFSLRFGVMCGSLVPCHLRKCEVRIGVVISVIFVVGSICHLVGPTLEVAQRPLLELLFEYPPL